MTFTQKIRRDKLISYIIMAVAILILLVGNLYAVQYDLDLLDKDIHTITWQEIANDIDGIGEEKAKLIVEFFENNPKMSIDDLITIDGIGQITIDKLNEEYKD